MIPEQWIIEAQSRISDHILNTPIIHDQNTGAFLKCENRQKTGSFKLRGALNKIIGLHDWEITPGLVTASAGNHGLGVALASQAVGASATVFVSKDAVPLKVDAIRSYKAEINYITGTYGDVEKAGIDYAKQSGRTWISPYNDGQVIAGQGTIAIEIITQKPSLLEATWVVPVGGGGLISGI
ncbi:MAG: pyridoxal-phosphate dependent enzyme, partial [Anaerolineales bacterium]